MGSNASPREDSNKPAGRGRLPPLQLQIGGNLSAKHGQDASSDESTRSRDDSVGANYISDTTSTPASMISTGMGALQIGKAHDPQSAHSLSPPGGAAMEREGSVQSTNVLPDLEQLSREKGRPLDVEDLDDAGWKAASKSKMIIEISSLGEGAGGAVTRCRLKDGKTEFALKVCNFGACLSRALR